MASGLEPPAGLEPDPGAGDVKDVEGAEDVEDVP
jgi:hypothetical protein